MEPHDHTAAHRIGRYEVRGELGTGGMAVVYRAHDPRLDRDVAVKVLHPHLARDAESRARFEREARAAARLRHPNIVEVYEFSAPDERESYMVTELLEGPTLRRFVERHPEVPAEVAALVGIVLCDALTAAHAQGVVHRDVKPDNLMLQRGQLKLTDFGIAYVADGHGMTVTGQVLGSPAHMAPEQIEGSAVDARTDVFAAGTLLYLLAVGRLPFEGANAHALLRRILDGEYTDAARAQPLVGHRFAGIVRRCLARDPAQRYPRAADLREDLCAFVREMGVEFPEVDLRRYFSEPEQYVAALKEKLRERLPQLGLDARRRDDVGAAMGYFNRALAVSPGDARVIALVRSVARRRQMQRALRAAGIIGGVATVTAAVALLVMERSVPPRPRPATGAVATEVDDRPEPTTVIVRAVDSHRAEPAPVALADAGSDEAVTRETPRVAHRTGAVTVRNGPARVEVPAVDAALGPSRVVRLFPNPSTVVYSVNGGRPIPWSSQDPVRGEFRVGQRIRLVVTSIDGSREPREWNGVIPPGDGDFRIPIRLSSVRTSPDANGTAFVHTSDASVVN